MESLASANPAPASDAMIGSDTDVDTAASAASALADDSTRVRSRSGATSRRALLRTAAAGATAAAVGAAAVAGDLAGAPIAHAAPEASGGNFILGQTNDAGVPTRLTNTGGTSPTPILSVYTFTSGIQGVVAQTAGSIAVNGYDTAAYGVGVLGECDDVNGKGVYGYSHDGFAVVGSSVTSVDLVAEGTGRIYQRLAGQISNLSGYYRAGESLRDGNGDLWLCTVSGTPGTWVQVAHPIAGLAGGAISLLSQPIRIFDSRAGFSDGIFNPGVPCTASSPTTVLIAGVSNGSVRVPTPLAGAIGNVTIANPQGVGYLELVPTGAGFTGAANLAYAPGQVISNAYTVGLNLAGALDIIIGGADVDVIVDLFAVVA